MSSPNATPPPPAGTNNNNPNGKEFGETRGERDLRHLRLRCQTLKQTYDAAVSSLKRARIEGAQSLAQLRDAVQHYQNEVSRGDAEVEALGDKIQNHDNALFHKQEAANEILVKEVAGTMQHYRKCRQLEEEALAVARERRLARHELNRLRQEQQHFYSDELLGYKKGDKKEEGKDAKKVSAKKKLSDGSSASAPTADVVISQRRVEAIAIANQIADVTERIAHLTSRLAEIEATPRDPNEFMDREGEAYTELYGSGGGVAVFGAAGGASASAMAIANNTTTTSSGAANTTAPPATGDASAAATAPQTTSTVNKFMSAAAAKKSLLSLSAATFTPEVVTVSHEAERSAARIANETARIERNTAAAVEAADRVTAALTVATEDANRETFDAMTEIKSLLNFLKAFEAIGHSEAATFFGSVCPRTDCHLDGIFVNSILSADDLWTFPEQYAAVLQRRAVVDGAGDDDAEGQSAASTTKKAGARSSGVRSASAAGGKKPPIASRTTGFRPTTASSSAEAFSSSPSFGGTAVATAAAAPHKDLIRQSVQTHLNRVVLDRCEAWARFFREDWFPRVNPSVALTAVGGGSGDNDAASPNSNTKNGNAAAKGSTAAATKRSATVQPLVAAHDTSSRFGRSPPRAPQPQSQPQQQQQQQRGTVVGAFVGRGGAVSFLPRKGEAGYGQPSAADISAPQPTSDANNSNADSQQQGQHLRRRSGAPSESPSLVSLEGLKTVDVSAFDTTTAFQRFLAEEEAVGRKNAAAKGREVQREAAGTRSQQRGNSSVSKNNTSAKSATSNSDPLAVSPAARAVVAASKERLAQLIREKQSPSAVAAVADSTLFSSSLVHTPPPALRSSSSASRQRPATAGPAIGGGGVRGGGLGGDMKGTTRASLARIGGVMELVGANVAAQMSVARFAKADSKVAASISAATAAAAAAAEDLSAINADDAVAATAAGAHEHQRQQHSLKPKRVPSASGSRSAFKGKRF